MIIKSNKKDVRFKRFVNPEFDIEFKGENQTKEVSEEIGNFLISHFPSDIEKTYTLQQPVIEDYDLNKDGVVDKKDFTIASNTLKKAKKQKNKED
jgi:hypothetical protein